MTTAVSSGGLSTGPALVVNGLISGITTPKVIDALLEGYQEPITDLEEKQTSLKSEAADYQTLATALQAVQTAAEALSTPAQWNLATATSSDDSVATAVAASGAQTGSLSFTVDRLAQANVLASSGGVTSEGERVTSSTSILLAAGAAGIGFSSLTAGSAPPPVGSYTIAVIQGSGAATVAGQPLAGTVTLTAPETLQLTVNGSAATLTIAAGTYSAAHLATAITAAGAAAGVQAGIGATGGLELSTVRQGGSASLSVMGATTLSALGLTAGQAARGSDAVVTVGGTTTTLTAITPGEVVTLHAPRTATLTATVAATAGPSGALVQAGTADAAMVSVGNGSLSSVVAAIDSSGLPMSASAVRLASGDDILQVSADQTGTAGAVTIGSAAFEGSALGTMRTITTAQDAEISVGGSGGYTLTSGTDTFTGLLSGTSVTVASKGQATVTVTQDATGEASRVTALVQAVNKALADVQKYAGYTTATKTGGPLMGDAVVTDIKEQILSTFAGASGTLGTLAEAGITLAKTGAVAYTREAFVTAYQADPTEVAGLFTQGGAYDPSASGAPGDVAFAFASTTTAAGDYAVRVSQSATQAVDTGAAVAGGAVSVPERLTVTMGSASVTYTTSAGEALSAVADGLNAAFAGAKLGVTAQVMTGGATTAHLELTSDAYGSDAAFTVTSSDPTGTTGLGSVSGTSVSGTNVAGTIDGVTATGNGQVLSVAPTVPRVGGLGLVVTATGISPTTPPVTLGSFDYRPGVAQLLASAMNQATNPQTGSLTAATKALTAQATGLDSQISMYTKLEDEQRTVLEKEFTTMETNLSKLQNESSELTEEIKKITTTTG